jgi:hypothetical protein
MTTSKKQSPLNVLSFLNQDRFLLAILAVIGILIVLALVLFFLRRGSQNYLTDNSPAAVVHNYVLALQKGNFQRAYGYLDEKGEKPSFTQFHQAFINNQLNTSTAAVQLGEVTITGDQATVSVILLQSGGGAFADTYRNTQAATTVRKMGTWKIDTMPFPYWSYDWYQAPPVPAKPVSPGG